jgi:hypothetical protein
VKYFVILQTPGALADFWHSVPETCRSEQRWNGVLHIHPLHDASLRHHVHRLLPLADEQGSRFHYVLAVLRVRRRLAHVRV